MKDRTSSLIGVAFLTLAWGLLLLFMLHFSVPPAARSANAQSGPLIQADPCTFKAIYVSARPTETFHVSDTLPGGPISRTVYFANHESGMIGILTVISDTCYVWGGAAFSQTEPMPFQPGGTNWLWLLYPVDTAHGSTSVVLTSSLYVTGSLRLPADRVVLTFAQDITAPHDIVITAPARSVEPAIPLTWSAADAHAGIAFYTVQSRHATNTTWQTILTNTTQSAVTFTAPVTDAEYAFRVIAYDYVGNEAVSDERSAYIGFSYIYLPLVLRYYPPPAPVGDVHIAGGDATVYDLSVTLDLSAAVERGVVTEMRLRNENAEWSEADWEPFAPTRSWRLSDGGNGARAVYAQFRSSLGSVSAPISDRTYLLLDGNFEAGPDLNAWRTTENPLPVGVAPHVSERPDGITPPADGDYVLLLGNPAYECAPDGAPEGLAAVEQTFNLPADVRQLTFKYVIWSQDVSLGLTYDRFEVYVNDELAFADGNQINDLGCDKWRRVPGPENPRGAAEPSTSGWAIGTIDLSPYAGQDVVVSFRNYHRIDGWYNTYTYVDAIAVTGGWADD